MSIETVNTVGEYRKLVKAFVAAIVRAKAFIGEDGKITAKAILDVNEEKKGLDTFSIACTVGALTAESVFNTPKKVSKKIDAEFFGKVMEMYNKRKNFPGLVITF